VSREFEALRQAAEAVLAHTSRIEVRRRNQLAAEFQGLATPERILALFDRLDELELQALADAARSAE
jgi:hypothetical protein